MACIIYLFFFSSCEKKRKIESNDRHRSTRGFASSESKMTTEDRGIKRHAYTRRAREKMKKKKTFYFYFALLTEISENRFNHITFFVVNFSLHSFGARSGHSSPRIAHLTVLVERTLECNVHIHMHTHTHTHRYSI